MRNTNSTCNLDKIHTPVEIASAFPRPLEALHPAMS
jgi:hypothetical protein